ncbi:retrovirus-related pol polyprotein from transposon TNT 1-94 [Tanacetum coccineum]
MSNNSNNLQTQTSSALHNAIMEADGKDHPLIVPSTITTTPGIDGIPPQREPEMETYATVPEENKKQIDAAEGFYKMINELMRNQCEVTNHQVNVQFLLQLKPEWQSSSTRSQVAPRNKGKKIANTPSLIYDLEPEVVSDEEATPKDKEIEKLMALILMSFKKIYKPTNKNLITSSNTKKKTLIILQDLTEELGTQVVQQTGIQCFNCKEFGHVARECKKAKRKKLIGQMTQMINLKIKNWKHITCTWQIFKRQHHVQLESINDTYFIYKDDRNITSDSPDMCNDEEKVDQDTAEEEERLTRYKESDFVKNVEVKCAKAYGLLAEKKVTSEKSFSAYTEKLINLNKKLSEMENELSAHKRTISTISFKKEEHEKFYKTHEDKEIKKVDHQLGKTTLRLTRCFKIINGTIWNIPVSPDMKIVIEQKLDPSAHRLTNDVVDFYQNLKEEMHDTLMVFDLNNKTFEITDLKAQLQDKNIAINLEVAFRKSTCHIRDLKGNDLLTGSHGTYLYSITLLETTSLTPICLMAKASSSQAWLWHHRLSHLNFDTINFLSKNDIVNGLPKLKFVKDHLCSSCKLGKGNVESINGNKYVLVIVDDYSRYTWTHFLRSKDETPEVLIDFLKMIQRGLQAQVRTVRTDRDGENLDKMKEKGDACIFIGWRQMTDSVNFDELPQMASDHDSSDSHHNVRLWHLNITL